MDQSCAKGPETLRAGGLIFHLRQAGIEAAWNATLCSTAGRDAVANVSAVAQRLARRTEALARRGQTPLVLGGDHSCAVGTWKGIAGALARRGPLGLIWIDAHLDAHTPATSPSGCLHGMPLACLLGYGDPRLTAIAGGAGLHPRRVCVIGVRSFEAPEMALLNRLGVRIFLMDEVERRGFGAVMSEALAIVRDRTAAYGISIDLDALDPREAPGVGSPVPGGIRAIELQGALARLRGCLAPAALEIAEYNPARDRNDATARVVRALIESLMGARARCHVIPRFASRAAAPSAGGLKTTAA
jgi:arginase